jgi:hypothetical protein
MDTISRSQTANMSIKARVATLMGTAAIVCGALIGEVAQAQEIVRIGNWAKMTYVDRFKDDTRISYFLHATSIISQESFGALGGSSTVAIHIMCGPLVSIQFAPDPMLFKTTVIGRFDRQPSWQFTSSDDLSYLRVPATLNFLSELAAASQLTIKVSSHISGNVVAEFDLKSAKQFVEDYHKSCGSKK